MLTIFDATRPVKTSRRFAAGLLRSLPTYQTAVSAADEQWLVSDNARIEREAAEAAAYDRFVDAAYERLDDVGQCSLDVLNFRGFDYMSHAEV